MHTQGEHANSKQKGSSRESNPEPFCCEATVLITYILHTYLSIILNKNKPVIEMWKWLAIIKIYQW